MGSNNSSEERHAEAAERELAKVRREKDRLEQEKLRLQQIAQEQHWAAQRLNEEQRLKDAAEKWRREQQHKDAYADLQRQLEALKVQQQQQKVQETSSVLQSIPSQPAGARETVSVQQRVPPAFENARPRVDTSKADGVASEIHQTLPMSSQTVLGANGVQFPAPTISGKPDGKPLPRKARDASARSVDRSKGQRFEWSIVDFVGEGNSVDTSTLLKIFKCFENGDTIPFMAYYRKDVTQGMGPDKLRNVKNSYDTGKSIKQRVTALFKEVKGQGNCTPEFQAFLREIKSLGDLNHVRSIFKVSKPTSIEQARYEMLGNIAKMVTAGEKIPRLSYLVRPESDGLENENQVRLGLVHIIADIINKDRHVFDAAKKLSSRHPIKIETKLAELDPEVPLTMQQEFTRQKYAWYNNFASAVKDLSTADVTNIKRGEAEKVLVVKIDISTEFHQAFKDRCFQLYKINPRTLPLQRELITAAVDYVYQRWIHPFIMKKSRAEINEKAENAVMENIAQNVKQLFLTLPVGGKIAIGIFSVSLWVCKLAAVSKRGDFLEAETIYPHNADNPGAKDDAEKKLVQMVRKYKCTTLAVGSGTACRENVDFLTNLIQKKAFGELEVSYRIVDNAGLIFYSSSREASSEFPTIDDNVVAAVSLARRLQNPIAELVKIEPQHLAAEMRQQDVPEKKLITKLNEVITEVVSFAGVDVNTASVSLLRRVAGLDEGKAKNIIEWREGFGVIRSRSDLMGVKGITTKTFEQCAGFIKIIPDTVVNNNGQKVPQTLLNRLDQTWIHPQYYDVAKAFLEAANCNVDKLGTAPFTFAVKLYADQDHKILAEKFGTTTDVIELIVRGLTMETEPIVRAAGDSGVKTTPQPAEHPKGKITFDDLTVGTVLTGVVKDIKDFGAFVHVGLGRHGLIHKQNMNGISLSVGQKVETTVSNIDNERRRFGLRLRKCL